jgi:hypothetical protein
MAKNVTAKYSKMMEFGIQSMKKNLILFVPNLLMLLVSVCLLMILYNVGGLHDLLVSKPFVLNDKALFAQEMSKLISTPQFTLSAVIWILGEILIGAYFVVVKYGMIRDVVKTGTTSLKNGLLFGERNYLKYWGVHIIAYLLIYGPFFILLAIYALFIKNNVANIAFSYLILGIFVIGWIVYSFLMGVRIFYIYPVMAFEKETVFETFEDDFHYVKTHMGHTFLSFMIVLAFVIGLKFMNDSVNVFAMSVSSRIIVIILALIMLTLEIVVTTWEHIFIFKSYQEGKHLKTLVKGAKEKKKTKKKKKAK